MYNMDRIYYRHATSTRGTLPRKTISRLSRHMILFALLLSPWIDTTCAPSMYTDIHIILYYHKMCRIYIVTVAAAAADDRIRFENLDVSWYFILKGWFQDRPNKSYVELYVNFHNSKTVYHTIFVQVTFFNPSASWCGNVILLCT